MVIFLSVAVNHWRGAIYIRKVGAQNQLSNNGV